MRHNQNNNGRNNRFRGRSNGHQNGGGGGGHHHNNHGGHNGSGQNRGRANPRVTTFDSNGPDVRIRGNAYQINEKYLALAKDAASAGDRILAESYLQHAEHYQRMINEMSEEYNRYQAQHQPQQQPSDGTQHMDAAPSMDGLGNAMVDDTAVQVQSTAPKAAPVADEQPSDAGLEDIGFLRNKPRAQKQVEAQDSERESEQV